MAEEHDLEKTEPASQYRLDEAREKGDVPRSRELDNCTILLAAAGGLWLFGGTLLGKLHALLRSGLTFDRAQAIDSGVLLHQRAVDLGGVLLAFAPLGLLLLAAAVVSPLLIGGWLFNNKALRPDFARLSPFQGLGNILSARSGLELGKAIGKAAIVATVALIVIWHQKEAVLALGLEPFKVSIAHLGDLLWTSFLVISGALLLIALVDAPYQVWHHANKLRMTRDQLRRETRESEGDPHIKARIRAQQREMARRRMMSEIPNADVVVTNPMHYAVALRYGDGATGAPRVVAKGADEVASRIREIATENGVPLLEAPPLARALYRHTDLGDEIPEALYTAVAEVLAYVFQLRMFRQRGGVRPVAPSRLAVPPHLDPLNDPRADFSDREPTQQ